MIFAIIIFIILLILFIHIRIKFKIEFIDKNLQIYIYKFKIPLNKKKNSTEHKVEKQRSEEKQRKRSKKRNSKLKNLLYKIKIHPFKLLDLLIYNKYKPKLVINNYVRYSLKDAALTAELFGGLNILTYIIDSLINLFLNFKPTFNIEPTFSNTLHFDIKLEGILSINLAQIILMLFLLLKSLSIKGGNPKGESYGK